MSISSDGKIGVEWNSLRMAWASTIIPEEDMEEGKNPIYVRYGCSKNDDFKYSITP